MPERQRDESVERLLPEVLAARPASATQACADAETIAAWTEGALREAEASALEQHLADCRRCQALVAASIRATPDSPPAEPLWRRWRLPWLVPLATAATAAALWFAIPDRSPVAIEPRADGNIAAIAEATAPPAAPPEAPAAPPDATRQGAAREEGLRADRPADRAPRPEERDSLARIPDAAKVEGNSAAPPAAPIASAQAFAARQATASAEVAAPSGARWRIRAEREVEWSRSAGSDWEPASITSDDDLTAGSAPSAVVCWLVGRRGAIFVTTNGAVFTRVSFPEIVDLARVSATDDQNATVTSVDGRSWRTTDQGRTWAAAR